MYSLTSVAAAAILAVAVNGQAAYELNGNWYTNAVDTIQYTNFGSSGTYNRVTSMDSSNGVCSSVPFAYSGSLAPLNGEVSVNIRGPFALKQFAFYSPGSASKQKRGQQKHKRHGHAHAHLHGKEQKRGVGDWVTATIDGVPVSWINEWSGVATPAPAAAAPIANVANAVSNVIADAAAPSAAPSYSGDYVRTAYYDSQSQTAQGVTFLNHMGGQGSGVFDNTFGNSLSYASSNAQAGSATSQILADATVPSNTEYLIMTDKECSGDSCGYTRPGGVAYHGFDGSNKVFLFEFSMPMDGQTGFNGDMPALWLLNADIPRTLQYGLPQCSCWTSGCGEFDIAEVLDSGNTRCKSTLHGNVSGGDSAYIDRPTGAPIKLALVMSDSTATIKVLDSSYDFSQSLTNAQIASLASSTSSGGLGTSFFNIVG